MSHDKNDYIISYPHDLGYKYLLAHQKVSSDLFHSFVDTNWEHKIDDNSLLEVSNQFVIPKFQSKESDKIYRLKLLDKEIYFYILIELQSTVDFLMPYRLLSYMVELWRQVIQLSPEKASKKDFRLPVIIPIVLYNGEYNWTAFTDFKDKLDSNGYFDEYLLNFCYILIDVNRFNLDYLKRLANTIGAIFIMDQSYDIIELSDRLVDATSGIKTFDKTSYADFIEWLRYIVCANLPFDVAEEFLEKVRKSSPEEADMMISNLAVTLKKALEKERTDGWHEGKLEGKFEIVKNMLKRDLPLDAITDITGLSLKEVLNLCNELNYKN